MVVKKMEEKLLDVRDLKTYFYTSSGVVKAVDGVSFSLNKGKTLGIVGESGSGKSITASSIMRLIPSPPGTIVGGKIIFDGKDVLKLSQKELLDLRGRDISMIFQDPMTALNPVFTIGQQARLYSFIEKCQRKRQKNLQYKLWKL